MSNPVMNRMTVAAIALAMVLTTTAGAAVTLLPDNFSFEADTFTTFPGYSNLGGNGPITGWASSDPAGTGINPGPTSPFANNGIIPNGTQVAFIQNGVRTLSQTITGLTPGNQYIVVYSENARTGNTAIGSTTFGGVTIVGAHNVVSGSYNNQVGTTFTATSTSHVLALSNSAGPDNTLLLDNVRIQEHTTAEGVVAGNNFSFEFDNFSTFPGYISGNGPITGWTVNAGAEARAGLNPANGSPFANNGVVPDGTQVGFLQAGGAGQTSLSTTVSNLTPGETYMLQMRLNTRSGYDTPQVQIEFGGSTVLQASEVTPVGGSNPYHYATFYVTPGSASETLTISNLATAGDATVVVDAVSVTPATPAWSTQAWTDDASSGITSGGTYTHAYNFGQGGLAAATTINGVEFQAAAGANPSASNFTFTGYPNAFGANDANSLDGMGGSEGLANSFIFNGSDANLTLTGLVSKSTNVLTLYAVGWDDSLGRTATFTSDGQRITVDENALGNNNGQIIQFAYTADYDGIASIDISAYAGRTFHIYGFANEATSVITDLFSTGVDGSGTPLGDNAVDPHWTANGGIALVHNAAGGFPVGPWLGDNTESAWVSTTTNTNAGPGSYTYQTTFTLPDGYNVAEIIGRFAADNSVTDVLLNGNSLGISGSGFNAWIDFVIGINSGFVEGVNTLQFVLNNAGESANPAGLRVEFTSAVAGFAPAPSALPAGLALLAMFGARRRRRA